jgi:TPR repeat protein
MYCSRGKGGKAAATEAVRWFQQAVDASYPPAMLNLGTLSDQGREGLPADPDKGRFLIRTAAEEGFAPAQVALGRAAEAEPEKNSRSGGGTLLVRKGGGPRETPTVCSRSRAFLIKASRERAIWCKLRCLRRRAGLAVRPSR